MGNNIWEFSEALHSNKKEVDEDYVSKEGTEY